jgi:hypothetical protein
MRLPSVALLALVAVAAGGSAVRAAPTKGGERVARYGVFEHELPWRSNAPDPQNQVSVDVRLRSPQGSLYRIRGFYAGPNLWEFRFAPPDVGRWTWSATVNDEARRGTFRGIFVVVKSTSPGFVRRSPYNPFRWTFTNKTPYYPIGLNDCTNIRNAPIAYWGFDGGFRTSPGHEQPGRYVDIATYMRAYSSAGFNLFRWGPDNCSFPLYERITPGGNVYDLAGLAAADRLFRTLRRYGFRIEMVLFGSNPPFGSAFDSAQLAAVDDYVRYIVSRYGAYVDYWEITNEASPSGSWLTQVAGYLERHDPYHHPVGTSWSRPELPVIQFGSDHWYESENPLRSDLVTWQRLRGEKAREFGKPTLVDEQGNVGLNWDPTSATRVRVRAWTAFFAEGIFVFWNTSFIKNCCPNGTASIYLGPEERSYVRILQDYTRNFDARAAVVSAPVTGSNAVRAYALKGPRDYGMYVVNGGDRSKPTSGVSITVDPSRGGTAKWIDPATGRIVALKRVDPRPQRLAVPAFSTDIALRITPRPRR